MYREYRDLTTADAVTACCKYLCFQRVSQVQFMRSVNCISILRVTECSAFGCFQTTTENAFKVHFDLVIKPTSQSMNVSICCSIWFITKGNHRVLKRASGFVRYDGLVCFRSRYGSQAQGKSQCHSDYQGGGCSCQQMPTAQRQTVSCMFLFSSPFCFKILYFCIFIGKQSTSRVFQRF